MNKRESTCKDCGEPFEYAVNSKGYPRKKLVCDKCHFSRTHSSCKNCGKVSKVPFHTPEGLKKKKPTGLCVTCFGKSTAGPKHGSWKGGFSYNKDGYLICSHGENKGRSQHRLVWEQHFGPIPEDHVIHHLNGVRDDNRIENLQCLLRHDHDSLEKPHGFVRSKIKQLQERIRHLEKTIQNLTGGV